MSVHPVQVQGQHLGFLRGTVVKGALNHKPEILQFPAKLNRMLLRVELNDFADAVDRFVGRRLAVIAKRADAVVATAAAPEKHTVVAASSSKPMNEVEDYLKQAGFELARGEWRDGDALLLGIESDSDAYVAAVAYKSREEMPGLWMDAFPHEPTTGEVLKALYDDFAATGDLEDVPFEEFVRVAHPNVVVLSPDDVAKFLRAHA